MNITKEAVTMLGLGDIYGIRQDAAEHAGGFFGEVDDTIECCDLCGATAPVDSLTRDPVFAELEKTPCE